MTQEQATCLFLVGLAMVTGAALWQLWDLAAQLYQWIKYRRKTVQDRATRELEIYGVSDGSYEWADFHVFRHPRVAGMFAIDFDAGASSSYYDYPSVDALGSYIPLSAVEVRHHFLVWLSNHQWIFSSAATRLGLVEELSKKLASERQNNQ